MAISMIHSDFEYWILFEYVEPNQHVFNRFNRDNNGITAYNGRGHPQIPTDHLQFEPLESWRRTHCPGSSSVALEALEALEALHACSVTINRLDVPQAQKICQKMDCLNCLKNAWIVLSVVFQHVLTCFWYHFETWIQWGQAEAGAIRNPPSWPLHVPFSAVARYHCCHFQIFQVSGFSGKTRQDML
jgi:hypothetical protein